MNRRDFLKLLGLTGLGTVVSKVVPHTEEKPIKETAADLYDRYGSVTGHAAFPMWCDDVHIRIGYRQYVDTKALAQKISEEINRHNRV